MSGPGGFFNVSREGGSDMRFGGSLSYLKPSETTVKLENGLRIKISRVNDDVARVYFVQAATVMDPVHVQERDVPIPAGFVFHNLTTSHNLTPFRNEWLISWTSKFELKRGEEVVLNIDLQRQQAIRSRKPLDDTTGVTGGGADEQDVMPVDAAE